MCQPKWFFEITFVQEVSMHVYVFVCVCVCMCVCMCVCVCVSLWAINNYSHEMKSE